MADIFGVRVTPGLDTLGTFVICNHLGGQIDPSVVFNDENFIVVWSDPLYDRNPGIAAALISPQGVLIDSNIHVGDGEDYPDIAYDGDRSLVVWHKAYTGIQGIFLNDLGQPDDSVFTIARLDASMTMPRITFSNDAYLVVYADFCSTGTDLDIYGRFITPQGQIIGGEIEIAYGPASQSYPEVAFDGLNYFIIWQENNNAVFGRHMSVDGVFLNDAFQISQDTLYTREYPGLAAGIDNYLVVWGEFHDDFDVYGNIDIMINIEEHKAERSIRKYPPIMSLRLHGDLLSKNKLYDISGRMVSSIDLKPGIYFVLNDRQNFEKVVVLR